MLGGGNEGYKTDGVSRDSTVHAIKAEFQRVLLYVCDIWVVTDAMMIFMD